MRVSQNFDTTQMPARDTVVFGTFFGLGLFLGVSVAVGMGIGVLTFLERRSRSREPPVGSWSVQEMLDDPSCIDEALNKLKQDK